MEKRQARARRSWVDPINEKRLTLGVFYTLFQELRTNEKKFFNYFRMSVNSFDELHQKLQHILQKQDTYMRDCIDPRQVIAVTLPYLASGCSFTDLHYSFRLGVSTISGIVLDVCTAIWYIMRKECIPPPTRERWEDIAKQFEVCANFPHCIGAVDGKHVEIVNPLGSVYFKYKGFSSVVLMAVADADYRFVYIDVGAQGKNHDSTVFQETNLWKAIIRNEIELPEPTNLPGTTDNIFPYFLIGDEAFPLHKHLLRPYGGSYLSVKKRVFNYRLSRARRFVEYTFGILSNKWRIFHKAINLEPKKACTIVKACAMLHNYVRDRDGYQFENILMIDGLHDLQGPCRGRMIRGGAIGERNILGEYFLNEGAVPWQMSKI